MTVGSVNPNNPLSEESREEQARRLSRCLNDYPKGIIIGKDTTIGRYLIGEHKLTMEKVTYHVGFQKDEYPVSVLIDAIKESFESGKGARVLYDE